MITGCFAGRADIPVDCRGCWDRHNRATIRPEAKRCAHSHFCAHIIHIYILHVLIWCSKGFRVELSGFRVYVRVKYASNASVLKYRSTSLLPERDTQTYPCIFVRSTLCMLYGCLAINSENWKKTCRGNAAATHRIHIFRKSS